MRPPVLFILESLIINGSLVLNHAPNSKYFANKDIISFLWLLGQNSLDIVHIFSATVSTFVAEPSLDFPDSNVNCFFDWFLFLSLALTLTG